MRIWRHLIITFIMLGFSAVVSSALVSSWYNIEQSQVQLNVILFLSSTCPHCQKADAFFIEQEKKDWLHVERYFIDKDKAALSLFNRYLQAQDSTNFSVPAIFFCDSHWIGFNDANNSGKVLLSALKLCQKQIVANEGLNSSTISALKKLASANSLETGISEHAQQSSFFTGFMAAIDALNPCSFVIVLVLFIFLIQQPTFVNRAIILLLFIIVLSLLHYWQQVNLLIFIQLLPWFNAATRIIGLLICIYVMMHVLGKKLNKQLLFGFCAITAIALQTTQHGCVPNIGLIYQQWLQAQHYSFGKTHFLLIVYNVVYATVIGLFAFLLWRLNQMQIAHRFKKWTSFFGYFFLLFLGISLLVYPALMTHSFYMILLIIIAAFLGQLLHRWQHRGLR